MALEQFIKRYQEITIKPDNVDQTYYKQASKNLEAAYLKVNLIFDLDNKPIPRVDTSTTTLANLSTKNTGSDKFSITLGS